MRIVLISGSHRQNSQSHRISAYLAARLAALDPAGSTDIVDLAGNPLPLWDESMWAAGSPLQKTWEPYGKRLQDAEGFVVVAPEWHGMAPAGLKNFFLYCGPKEVGHKPGLIVGVSASHGGSYPVNELRTSSYKNSKLCYIPEHLIIRNAEHVFGGDAPSGKDDEYLRGRADFALRQLLEYAKALKSVRDSGAGEDKRFPFGM